MITLLAIALTTAAGAPAAMRLRIPGLAFLFGSGIVYAAMALVPWHPLVLLAVIAALAIVLLVLVERRPLRPPVRAGALDLATVALLIAYALYATAAAPWHWDFSAIWGLKARVFFEHGGIDWHFLRSPWNAFAHTDYPLLVPLQFALPSVLGGEWTDRWLGLVPVAFLVSFAIVVRQLTSGSGARVSAALTFAVTALAASQYTGLAEVPVIVFGAGGVMLAREAMLRDPALFTPAAILLGLSAGAKMEGLTLIAAVGIALIVCGRWRDALRLWPSVAIALPWLIARAVAALSLDLTAGSPLARAAERLPDALTYLALLVGSVDKPWCWLAVLLALPLAWRRERLLVLIVLAQACAFIAAYAVTPNDFEWHVATAWDRLSRQLLVLAAYAALIALPAQFTPMETSNAEAGSER